MLTLITSIWYLCGTLFALYVIFCAVCILLFEREACRCLKALFTAYSELDSLFESCEGLAVNDIDALSHAFAAVLELKRDPEKSFEFYRQKEHFEDLAGAYNASAQKYNQLITNYPSCVLARVMGKEPVLFFMCE